jgi:hypothetical protein
VYYIYKEKLLRKSSSVNGRKPFQSSCHFFGDLFQTKEDEEEKRNATEIYENNNNSSNNNNNNNNHNIIKIEEETKK